MGDVTSATVPANGFPSSDEWPPEYAAASSQEGWVLSDADGSVNGRTQLQRLDNPATFASDREAWVHIVQQARTGSALHQCALDLVAAFNANEAAAISVHTGKPCTGLS